MKFRRPVWRGLILLIFALISLLAAWRVFRIEERLRTAVIEYLNQTYNLNVAFKGLDFKPTSLTLTDFEFHPSASLAISAKSIKAHFSPLQLARARLREPGSVREVEIADLTVALSAAEDSIGDGAPLKYPSHPLKSLGKLNLVRRVSLTGGKLTAGGIPDTLLSDFNGMVEFNGDGGLWGRLTGTAAMFHGSHLKASLIGDFHSGDLSIEMELSEADLSSYRIPTSIKGVSGLEGKLSGIFLLVGAEDLRLTGRISLVEPKLRYGEVLKVTGGEVQGELFGTSLRAQGLVGVNGMPMPIELEVRDLARGGWSVVIRDTMIDLADLDVDRFTIPVVEGRVRFLFSAFSDGASWEGGGQVEAPVLRSAGVVMRDVSLGLLADEGGIAITGLDVDVFGGELNASGQLDSKQGQHAFRWEFHRRWTKSERVKWLRTPEADLKVAGEVRMRGRGLVGDGYGTLYHQTDTLLFGTIDILAGGVRAVVKPPAKGTSLTCDLSFPGGKPRLRLLSDDPQRFTAGVLPSHLVPAFLSDWTVALDIAGDVDSLHISAAWRSGAGAGSGTIIGDLTKRANDWSLIGQSGVNLTTAGLSGPFNFNLGSTGSSGRLTWYDAKQTPVIQIAADWQQSLTDADFQVKLRNLPFVEFVQQVKPDLLPGFTGALSGEIARRNGEFAFSPQVAIMYPDSARLELCLNGIATDSTLSLERLELLNAMTLDTVLRGAGYVNFRQRRFDDLIIQSNGMRLEHITGLMMPNSPANPRGLLNSRLEADGPLDSLRFRLETHLSSGELYGNSGYWANVQCRDDGENFRLDDFSLGRNLGRLFHLTGWMSPRTGDFQLRGAANELDTREASRLAFGGDGPMNSVGNLAIEFRRARRHFSGEAKAEFSAGLLGPLTFDRMALTAHLDECERLDAVTLDSVNIDWGDASGRISGTLPLSEARELDIVGAIRGRLTGLLVRLTDFFSQPRGEGEFSFHVTGPLSQPRIHTARLKLNGGGFRMADVLNGIDNLRADLELDSTGRLGINRLDGEVSGKSLAFGNRFPDSSEGLRTLMIGRMDLGVVSFRTSADGIWMVIPGLMESHWGGSFSFAGKDGSGAFEFQGPWQNPIGRGKVTVRNATLTYPLLRGGGEPSKFTQGLLNVLSRTRWDAVVVPEAGCRYINQLTGIGGLPFMETLNRMPEFINLDLPLTVDLLIDDNPAGLHFTGAIDDSLRLDGELTSGQGEIQYLDIKFNVDKVTAAFTPTDPQPFLSGLARTAVMDTSISPPIPREIRLVIQGRQRGSTLEGMHHSAVAGERWEDIRFALEDDQGHSQEQILAMMGWTPEGFSGKLLGLGGAFVEQAVPLRRWTRFIEQRMQRLLGIDRVEFQPAVARNIIERRFNSQVNEDRQSQDAFSYLQVLDQSRLTVGKYLTPDLYVSYTGSLLSGADAYNVTRLGVVHSWDMLIRVSAIAPNFNLNYRYMFNSLAKSSDNSIRLSYSFYLKP